MKNPRLLELEMITKIIGDQIKEEMNDLSTGPPIGFALMMFDFGDDGFMTYYSNAQRDTMIKAMKETIALLEQTAKPEGQG